MKNIVESKSTIIFVINVLRVCLCVCVCVVTKQKLDFSSSSSLFCLVQSDFDSNLKTKQNEKYIRIKSSSGMQTFTNIHTHNEQTSQRKNEKIFWMRPLDNVYMVCVPKNEFWNWKQYWMNEWCKLYKSESLKMRCYILDFHWTYWMCFLFWMRLHMV